MQLHMEHSVTHALGTEIQLRRIMHCFGCGVDLLETKDRRALDSPAAVDVVKTWKLLLFVELNVDVGTLLRGEDSQRPPKMCKKCFTAYRTYGRHYQVIDRRKHRID